MEHKIGIDFHGVIGAQPKLFEVFCREIRRQGVEVYVISGGPMSVVERYLKQNHIEYDKVWAIYDYYEAAGKVAKFDDGSFEVPTELWNRAKAEYCHREGITFHIDDSEIYGKYFVTSYCLYDMEKDVCALQNGIEIDFKNPIDAAHKVAQIIKGI